MIGDKLEADIQGTETAGRNDLWADAGIRVRKVDLYCASGTFSDTLSFTASFTQIFFGQITIFMISTGCTECPGMRIVSDDKRSPLCPSFT